MALGNRRTNRSVCLEQFFIDNVSFKRNSISLGLVLWEEKLFTWTCTLTQALQSNAIMSGDKSFDIKKVNKVAK